MNTQLSAVYIGGRQVRLGRRIGRGGEGDVYLIESDPKIAVKLYTLSELGDRAEKIRALVAGGLAAKEALVAFPIAEARSPSGEFVGFSMRLVDGCKPLHELYAPGPRKINFPHADYRFLVRTAANVARAVAAVHRNGCVIGDINHSGILVSAQAVVALIDADSFQVHSGGSTFLCKVGVPEYTPPELQGRSLEGVTRTPNHDAFGLAVVVFQLLFMGRHPFVGTVRRGDIPPIHENIAARRYVYTDSVDVGMDQPPGTPSVQDFYAPLSAAFDRAFLGNGQRPSAEDWVRVLDALEASLVKCQDNQLHYIPRDASECAWCEMEKQLGMVLFLPYVAPATLARGTDPGSSFDVEAVWRQILVAKTGTNIRLQPQFPKFNISPSEAAKRAKSESSGVNPGALIAIVLGVLGFFAAPKAGLLWLLMVGGGIVNLQRSGKVDATSFQTGYIASEQIFQRELSNWNKRNGVDDFLKMFGTLEAAHDEYLQIKREEALEISRQGEQRRASQLAAYLNTFPIEQASIKGIGPSTRAVLASYGIDTAADIQDGQIQNVPGVGVKLSARLLEWRRKVESQFVYRPQLSALDQAAMLQARVKAETRLAPLRATLVTGPQNLSALAARTRQFAAVEDSVLVRAAERREQAKHDLEFLGIALPHVPPPPQVTPSARPPVRPPSPAPMPTWHVPSPAPASRGAPAPSSGAVLCPRCSSTMVKRLAKRGRNAGSYFWGCSRYPTCKGTRNI